MPALPPGISTFTRQPHTLPLGLCLTRSCGLTANRGALEPELLAPDGQDSKLARVIPHKQGAHQQPQCCVAFWAVSVRGQLRTLLVWMTLSPCCSPSSKLKHIFFAVTDRILSEVCLPNKPSRCLHSPKSRPVIVGIRGTGSKHPMHARSQH